MAGLFLTSTLTIILLAAVTYERVSCQTSTFKVGVVDQVIVSTYNATTRLQAMGAIRENLITMEKYAKIASEEVSGFHIRDHIT